MVLSCCCSWQCLYCSATADRGGPGRYSAALENAILPIVSSTILCLQDNSPRKVWMLLVILDLIIVNVKVCVCSLADWHSQEGTLVL